MMVDEVTNSVLADATDRSFPGNLEMRVTKSCLLRKSLIRQSYLVRKRCLVRKSYLVKKVIAWEKVVSLEKVILWEKVVLWEKFILWGKSYCLRKSYRLRKKLSREKVKRSMACDVASVAIFLAADITLVIDSTLLWLLQFFVIYVCASVTGFSSNDFSPGPQVVQN